MNLTLNLTLINELTVHGTSKVIKDIEACADLLEDGFEKHVLVASILASVIKSVSSKNPHMKLMIADMLVSGEFRKRAL